MMKKRKNQIKCRLREREENYEKEEKTNFFCQRGEEDYVSRPRELQVAFHQILKSASKHQKVSISYRVCAVDDV